MFGLLGSIFKATRNLSFGIVHHAQIPRKPLLCSPFELSIVRTESRSYKIEDKLRLRCRDCFCERREGRLFVECKTRARHRQAQKMREPITPWAFKRKIWKTVKWF